MANGSCNEQHRTRKDKMYIVIFVCVVEESDIILTRLPLVHGSFGGTSFHNSD